MFSRRLLGVGGTGFDMLLGVIVLFPAGFVFSDAPQYLPPSLQSSLFAPHVAVYMLSYIIMAKAAYMAFEHVALVSAEKPNGLVAPDEGTYRMICFGFPLLTLGLILGSVWAQIAWGRYWGWDPKEMWSLATWLAYAAYFHSRYVFGKKYPVVNSMWALFGFLLIIITLLWANLARIFTGLHSYAS
jgi:ABC-type transport system involved in cytochrome c biogenesis permease subunit